MMRHWLQTLARKLFSARRLQRRRPARRPLVQLRLDALEVRTVMSIMGIEAPGLLPVAPGAVVPDQEPEAISDGQEPVVDPGVVAPEFGDPGWDKLLQDVIDPPKVTPPDPTIVSDPGRSEHIPGPSLFGGQSRPDRGPVRPGADADTQADPSALNGTDVLPPRQARAPRTAGRDIRQEQPAPKVSTKDLPPAAGGDSSAPTIRPSRFVDVAVARPLGHSLSAAGYATSDVCAQTHPAQPRAAGSPQSDAARIEIEPLPADLPDGSLLQRFVLERDQSAFAALVQRHERLVLGICQRVLGDSHLALDAFQVTFLVLARKASMIDRDGPLAGWLYKVAYHLALRLRAVAARRRSREKDAVQGRSAQEASIGAAALEKDEMQQALSEELQRLPEKYRAPLVLCYFNGRTHDEAARAIGMPRGSMAKRIGEGLEHLRQRLTDRGFLP